MRHSLWNGNSDRQCAAQTTVFATKKPTAIGFQTGSGQTVIGLNPALRSALPPKLCKTLLQNRNQSQHVCARGFAQLAPRNGKNRTLRVL